MSMRFPLPLPALLLLLSAAASARPGWDSVWADEFAYAGRPDPAKWRIQVGPSTVNGEAQYYSDRLQNLEVRNGELHITARKENFGGRSYTSGRLDTETRAWWTYGRFEIKARLAGGKGSWPAFWTLGHDCAARGGWPACGEIDICEYAGKNPNRVNCTLHMRDVNYRLGNNPHGSALLSDVARNWHIYAMEWFPDRIDIWMDSAKVLTYRNDGKGFGTWPYTHPQYIIMNLALGGGYGGPIDDAIFPTEFVIDYVRVFKEGNGPTALRAPARETGGMQAWIGAPWVDLLGRGRPGRTAISIPAW